MNTSYIKAIERKLSRKGWDDEKIKKEIKKILNPTENKEEEKEEFVNEVGEKKYKRSWTKK